MAKDDICIKQIQDVSKHGQQLEEIKKHIDDFVSDISTLHRRLEEVIKWQQDTDTRRRVEEEYRERLRLVIGRWVSLLSVGSTIIYFVITNFAALMTFLQSVNSHPS